VHATPDRRAGEPAAVDRIADVLSLGEQRQRLQRLQSVGLAAAVTPDEQREIAERQDRVAKRLEPGEAQLIEECRV
jgi:hypothetical protein